MSASFVAPDSSSWCGVPFVSASMRERISACYFHQFATKSPYLLHHISDGNVFAATKSVFAVAPDASHWTPGEAHEGARPASVS